MLGFNQRYARESFNQLDARIWTRIELIESSHLIRPIGALICALIQPIEELPVLDLASYWTAFISGIIQQLLSIFARFKFCLNY